MCFFIQQTIGKTPAVRTVSFLSAFIILQLVNSLASEVSLGQDGAPPEQVLLKWKFETGQTYVGKFAYGIKTDDENPKQTTFTYDFHWQVILNIESEGKALATVEVDRVRMRHRSKAVGDGFVEYDSEKDEAFQASETAMKELKEFLSTIRSLKDKKFQLLVSGQGEVELVQKIPHAIFFMSPASLPTLPKKELKVGDTWETKRGTFKLTKIEKKDGQTVATIESNKDTSRYRFLVDGGRFLDRASWDVNKYEAKPNEFFVQSHSIRLRYELKGASEPFDQWAPIQPQQGKVIGFIVNSARETPAIKENLMNEKGLLSRIQNSLFIEHFDKGDYPKPTNRWRPMDWLMAARIYQRQGKTDDCKKMLRDGLDAVASMDKENALTRDHFLMLIANKMIEIGDYEGATNAAAKISGFAENDTVFSGRGVVDVPKDASASYVLLRVAIEQAKSGQFEKSISTAESIKAPQTKSAAYWMVAMELADQGKMERATELAKKAGQLYSPKGTVIEFTREGPTPVPLQAYRTLSLGRIALLHALNDKPEEVRTTLAMIPVRSERNAVLTDIVISLEERGLKEIADKWAKEIPPLLYGISVTYRTFHRAKQNDLGGIEELIESVTEPTWKVASAMNYCQTLRKQGKHEAIKRQIDLAQKTIDNVSVPMYRLHALTAFATMLADLGRKEEANNAIQKALTSVDFKKMTIQQSIEAQMKLALLVAELGSNAEFDELMQKIRQEVDRLGSPEKETAEVEFARVYLQRGDLAKAESLAQKIDSPSFRVRALAEVAKKYGEQLELEKSREVFADAYDSAWKVVDAAGLDTVYSKGGALRHVARMQGEVDLEGLVLQIEKSPNANLKAYGFLAAAETLSPDSAAEASKLGRQPDVVLQEICETNRACQIISGTLGPPKEAKNEN